MNLIATIKSTKSAVSKRAVSSLLVAMLGATAIMSGENSILNANSLLTVIWPVSLIAVSLYWLRAFLGERAAMEYDSDVKVQSHIASSGLYMTPVCLTRT